MGADFELEVKLGIRDPFDFILVIDEIPASDVSHHDANQNGISCRSTVREV
jgi:hypothetical protein